MRKRVAFSLLEVVGSMAIMAVVMVCIFGVFEMGHQSYHYASLRQGLQAEARIIYLQLHSDLRHSSFVSVTALNRTTSVVLPRQESKGAQTLNRDGLCMSGVRDWAAAGSIDPVTGFPNFNDYVVYYATTEPEGRFIRQEVVPAMVGTWPNTQFSVAGSMNDNPLLNLNRVDNPKTLSKRVLAFWCQRNDGNRLVNVKLKLRGMGGKRPGSLKRSDETFELSLHSYPENTYPKV